MRESGKSQHAILDYFADDDFILDLLNRVADAGKVQPATNSVKTDILATQFGGVIPAMWGGGNTEDYQSTSEIPTYWDEESQSFKRGTPRVIGMSGTDPIGEVYVTGKAFTKALDIIGDAYRWKSRTDAINDYRDWLRSSEWNRSSNARAKSMRELLKDGYRKHGGDGNIFSSLANDVANVVQNGVKLGEKLLGFENGGVIPAMQNGGENEPLQDPRIKTITLSDGSTIQTL